MSTTEQTITSLADVLAEVEANAVTPTRRRDMISAIKRICTMAGMIPATVKADPATLRPMVNGIRPALHGVSDKTWANLRSSFVAALELAGVIDSMGRGDAVADAAWGPLDGLDQVRQADVLRPRRLRQLVRRQGHPAGRGGRRYCRGVPRVAGGADALAEAA